MVNYNAIVSIVKKITEKKGPPCKKTLQKIVFLIEAKKVNLGCDYGIHFYGPYSADLDFAVRELCDEGLLSIKYTDLEHKIIANNDFSCDKFENEAIDEIIDEFANDSPSELELLATALYVYLCTKDESKIYNGVIKIKGEKYNDTRINSAIKRLQKNHFIVSSN